MQIESVVTRSVIDENHYLDIEGDKIASEGGVRLSMMDQLHSWDI